MLPFSDDKPSRAWTGRRHAAAIALAAALAALNPVAAYAEDVVKVGIVIPMTGAFAAIGREVAAGARLFVEQHGNTVAGKKIELIIRDDGGVPDSGKRLAQDLIVTDKVSFIGAGITPSALAMAPVVSEAKVPTVVLVSGTSILTERSPYFVRTSVTLGQQAAVIADWATRNGSRRDVGIITDWTPGTEASKIFEQHFNNGGGQVLDTLRIPLANPDFAPFLQRARDLAPDTLFVSIPAFQAVALARQFSERGLDKSGIKLIGPGDIVDDDDLAGTGDALIGVETAGFYSAAHPSKLNEDYVAAYAKATGHRANHISVGGYDGMNLIYLALEKTGGSTDPDRVIAAMKGLSWESPRGPIAIDPRTRDIVQNIYVRKVEKRNGEPWAVEFATFEAVKDPVKEAAMQ
ncbi:MAG TPA: ABC transporter substrate-binding protein [Xanthobacteraceae bacterium]|nr:ABC transporter substrate-binding protein [Xanthobacteraceae bacterium]